MKKNFLGMLILSWCLLGCGEKSTPQTAPAPSVKGSAGSAPAATSSPTAHAAAVSAIQSDMADPNPEVYLKTLTDLLNGWVMSRNSFPTNLDDFVKAKMISKLPTPPPGKKLAIDRKTVQVVLLDQ